MLKVIIIAASLMAEAEGEGEAGLYSVADTIANRMELRKTTAVAVVEQRGQYATLTPDQIKVRAARSPAVWAFCLNVARQLLTEKYIPTSSWTHFYAPARCKAPAWAAKLKDRRTVGNHVFGRLET